MKAFSFRLQSLLMLRESKKNLAMINYRKILKRRIQAEYFIKKELEKQINYEKQFSKKDKERFSPKTATQQSLAIDYGRKTIGLIESTLVDLKKKEKKSLKELLDAKSQLTLLEKLKAKKQSAYKHQYLEWERKEIEEIAQIRRNWL